MKTVYTLGIGIAVVLKATQNLIQNYNPLSFQATSKTVSLLPAREWVAIAMRSWGTADLRCLIGFINALKSLGRLFIRENIVHVLDFYQLKLREKKT